MFDADIVSMAKGRASSLAGADAQSAIVNTGKRVSQRARGQVVVNAPAVGPHLGATARHIEDQAEQIPAGLLDRRFAGGDAAGVKIDQVLPAPAPARCASTP